MQVSKETVTPKKAREWLKRNVNNRPLRERYAQRLAEAIQGGEWQLNGETIKFNGNGDLLDGQHRLEAVTLCNKSIESYIIRGVQHEAFDTIDTGTPRKVADAFARSGEVNCNVLGAAVRVLWELTNFGTYMRGASNGVLRNAQAAKVLAEHPEVRESINFMQATSMKKIWSISISAALHHLFSKINKEKTEQFFVAVTTGEGLTKTMPAYQFRERCLENRGNNKAKLDRWQMTVLCIKALKAHIAGLPIRCLKSNPGEEYPKIQ